MENDELERLLALCNSNDVDVKVNGITKLQTALDSGIEITDKDAVINVLKSCLRVSNQHLTTATLAAIPSLLPLLVVINTSQSPTHLQSSHSSSNAASSPIDAYALRQILNAFLPAGGVIDRLGDSRDKAREKARETMVLLGGFAFRASSGSLISSKSKDGKGPETPLMMFERFLREGGLSNKVWRVREQSILTLVHLRRTHQLFPIRPYLPLLVAALEDGDAHVRECARESIIELFTGPGVTDAARADLKTTMAKKNVRKGIVESILSKLLSGSNIGAAADSQGEGSVGNEGGEKPKDYVPPSLVLQGRRPTSVSTAGPMALPTPASENAVKEISRPPSRSATAPGSDSAGTSNSEVRTVYITSSRDMENEFHGMSKAFEGKETEHNWSAREQAILRVRGMVKGEVHLRYKDAFLACLKEGFIQWSLKTLASLRTTVAVNTCLLYDELASAFGPALDPFCETLLTHLLRMAGFTKKLTAQHSQMAVTTIITHCSAQARLILPLLWQAAQEKTVQARAFIVGHIKLYLEVHGQRSKHFIETTGGLELLEKSVRRLLADANPAVRENARICFWVFENVWHERGRIILDSLNSTTRKQLENACPNPQAAVVAPSESSPKVKKSSVSAAIAASRAKAKAIAAAPPTLRHQAASSSHAARAISPPLPGPRGHAINTSMSTPAPPTSTTSRTSSSPPTSPRSRVVANFTPVHRSASSSSVSSESRPPPAARTVSPTSSANSATVRRSPLISGRPTSNSFRTALQTALPASPPPISVARPVSNRSGQPVPVPAVPRPSVLLTDLTGENDLLMASAIPIPENSDSDNEDPVHHLSFSAAFENSRPAAPRSNSQARSFSPKSVFEDPHSPVNNALSSNSTPAGPPQPIVEDAMRARAEQAESAAERLLELVDPEEEAIHHSSIPSSLLIGGNAMPSKPKIKAVPVVAPTTPMNRSAAVLKQAAMFKNSPPPNGKSSSLLDVLIDRKHETGWWVKRMAFIKQNVSIKTGTSTDRRQELKSYITALENGEATVRTLQALARLCIETPVTESPSPLLLSTGSSATTSSPSPVTKSLSSSLSLQSDIWAIDKNFNRLWKALMKFLMPTLDEDLLEYGLIVLWEIMHHQAPHVDGREAELFSFLLRIRYSNKANVLEATNALRDDLTTTIEPVYGLTTMHASLRDFRNEAVPPESTVEVKASTYAFGLSALGKFILRLPSEVLEDELPRMRETLTSALSDRSSLVVRESAAASIIAAQLVLQDETHLFTLLDGLADDKKNLLTYLFDKHAVRAAGRDGAPVKSGMERLVKEMSRLDARTSTPLKSTSAM